MQHSSMKYGPVPSALDLASDTIDLIPRETTPAQMPYAWLIEINPRPPGIQETAAVESTYGVDYWGIALLAALRDHRRLAALAHPFRNGPQYWCEMIFIPVTSGGIFASDDVSADLVQRQPDLAKHISKSFCLLRRGDVVPSPLSGITAWVAYFIVFSRVSREHLLVLSADIRRESRFSIVAH